MGRKSDTFCRIIHSKDKMFVPSFSLPIRKSLPFTFQNYRFWQSNAFVSFICATLNLIPRTISPLTGFVRLCVTFKKADPFLRPFKSPCKFRLKSNLRHGGTNYQNFYLANSVNSGRKAAISDRGFPALTHAKHKRQTHVSNKNYFRVTKLFCVAFV